MNCLHRPTHGTGNLKGYGPLSHCIRTMKSNHSWLIHKTKEGTLGGPTLAVHYKGTDQTGSELVLDEGQWQDSKASQGREKPY